MCMYDHLWKLLQCTCTLTIKWQSTKMKQNFRKYIPHCTCKHNIIVQIFSSECSIALLYHRSTVVTREGIMCNIMHLEIINSQKVSKFHDRQYCALWQTNKLYKCICTCMNKTIKLQNAFVVYHNNNNTVRLCSRHQRTFDNIIKTHT